MKLLIILKIVFHVQKEKDYMVSKIRSDHHKEFKNHSFEKFYNELKIKYQFAAPQTPQQNGVGECKNRILQETAWTMLIGGT